MNEFGWGGGPSAFHRRKITAAAREVSAISCGVSEADVRNGVRKADVVFARQLAMYLCHVVANMSLREISQAFGRDRTTVNHACHMIEDQRECAIFDRQIDLLEKEFRGRVRAVIADAARSGPPFERKAWRRAS